MQPIILYIIITLLPLSFCIETAQSAELGNSGCATIKCHNNMLDAAKVHLHDTNCSMCHQKLEGEHPDPQQINFTTKEDCLGCHERTTDHNRLHSPVASGSCIFCHKAHGSQNNNLHEQKSIICYKCHNNVVKEEDTVLHGELSLMECEACHNTHGSDYPKLLQAPYSTDFFNDYHEKHYELCFKCHKIDLLLHPQTSYNTQFRDKKNNLHFVHVNKRNKGRSCKTCHAIHASPNPYLIADSISFGNWQMPINYIPTENGGSCSPGCHATAAYDRRRKK